MYYKLILQVLGGLALFIFGINSLSDSLQKGECMPVSGVIFSDILLHFERTRNLLYGISKNMIEIGRY